MKGPLWGKWSCVSDLWPSPQAPPPAARPTKLPCEKLKQNREQMFRFLSLQNKGALQVSTIAVPNARATYGVPRDSAARVAAPAEASFAPTYAWAPGGELPARGPRPPCGGPPFAKRAAFCCRIHARAFPGRRGGQRAARSVEKSDLRWPMACRSKGFCAIMPPGEAAAHAPPCLCLEFSSPPEAGCLPASEPMKAKSWRQKRQ